MRFICLEYNIIYNTNYKIISYEIPDISYYNLGIYLYNST
uniref:Uncharacterized protein n=1 Tax=viral metagenome TaxID=1070528 RepID=A0A6C0JWS6_9ZZZZ